jgi:hypothetical protein
VLTLPVLAVIPAIVSRRDEHRRKRRLVMSILGASAVVAATGGLFWYLQLWNYLT